MPGGSNDGTTQEASVAAIACVVATGLGVGGLLFLLRDGLDRPADKPAAVAAVAERLDPRGFDLLGSSRLALACSAAGPGAGPRWQGAALRLRLDDHRSAAGDAAATRRLAGRLAPAVDLAWLDHADVQALKARLGVASAEDASNAGESRVLALRVEHGKLPQNLREGPVVTIELCPGFGLQDLYGDPGMYVVQEESVLRQGDLARAGRYNARDLFSARPNRVQRALATLAKRPDGRLRIWVEDSPVALPEGAATPEDDSGDGLHWLGGVAGVTNTISEVLQREGAPLVTALLRAQCGAGSKGHTLARDLLEVLRQHGANGDLEGAISEQDVEEALARGFWTLPADESGMHLREREAERLLERARRELWVKGSASRRELEVEIRKHLCRYLLGCAAANACLRFTLVRPAGGESELALSQRGFWPAPAATGAWCRLELSVLEVPLWSAIADGTARADAVRVALQAAG